jgi:hypothetical protein
MATTDNTQNSDVKVEIKSNQIISVTALVRNNAICSITDDSLQTANTQPNEPVVGFIKPGMVIDFHPGQGTELRGNNDPRFLIEPNPRRLRRWSLGDGGWIILGFENGFEAIRENVIQFVELETGEWADIWVAKSINNNQPVYYNRPFDYYKNPNNRGLQFYRSAKSTSPRKYQAGEDLTNPDDIRNIINPPTLVPTDPNRFNRPPWIPENWLYAGAVLGNETSSVDGPHLGIIGEHFPGNYYYILVHDVSSYSRVPLPWGGPDIAEIGVYLTNATREMYFLLVIDDSLSPTEGNITYYRNTVESQIRIWSSIQSQNQNINTYLGVRMIRWKNGQPPAGWCNNREFNAENYSQNYSGNELTERLRFNFSLNGNSLENQIWIPFSQVNEAMITTIRNEIKLDKQFTPLIEALGDIINHDLKDKNGQNIPRGANGKLIYSFTIKIITDGIPDPCDKFNSQNINDEANINILKNFIGSMDLETIPVYSVRRKLIDLKNIIRGPSIKLIGDFMVDSSGNIVHWIIDEYKRLKDENGKPLLNITLLPNVIAGSGAVQRLDHNSTYHTDCLDGRSSHRGRIGANEAKRVIKINNTPLRLPVSWPPHPETGNVEMSYENEVEHNISLILE